MVSSCSTVEEIDDWLCGQGHMDDNSIYEGDDKGGAAETQPAAGRM